MINELGGINTIDELLKRTEQFMIEASESQPQEAFCYRGQADALWEAAPSVFREGYLDFESRMIEETVSLHPSEFEKRGVSDIETLVKLQHFGLPTRLIDVTTNPLVALYFACQPCQSPNADGRIYFMRAERTQPDGIAAQLMAFYALLPERALWLGSNRRLFEEELTVLLGQRGLHGISYEGFLEALSQDRFVIPAQTTERLQRQAGAFILFGNSLNQSDDLYDRERPLKKKAHSLEQYFDSELWVADVPGQSKGALLCQLDVLGINEAFLFCELEHTARYVRQKYAEIIARTDGAEDFPEEDGEEE